MACQLRGPYKSRSLPLSQAQSKGAEAPSSGEDLVYRRNSQLKIQKLTQPRWGSLFDPKNPRNDLYALPDPWALGRVVEFAVKPRSEGPSPPKDPTKEKENPKALLKSLRLKVLEAPDPYTRVLGLSRESANTLETSMLELRAKTYLADPFNTKVSTEDLYDLELSYTEEGQAKNLNSLSWEDDYGTIINSFPEARSPYALYLEQKAKDLEKERKELKKRIENLEKSSRATAPASSNPPARTPLDGLSPNGGAPGL